MGHMSRDDEKKPAFHSVTKCSHPHSVQNWGPLSAESQSLGRGLCWWGPFSQHLIVEWWVSQRQGLKGELRDSSSSSSPTRDQAHLPFWDHFFASQMQTTIPALYWLWDLMRWCLCVLWAWKLHAQRSIRCLSSNWCGNLLCAVQITMVQIINVQSSELPVCLFFFPPQVGLSSMWEQLKWCLHTLLLAL